MSLRVGDHVRVEGRTRSMFVALLSRRWVLLFNEREYAGFAPIVLMPRRAVRRIEDGRGERAVYTLTCTLTRIA